jgi:hypothetical protein
MDVDLEGSRDTGPERLQRHTRTVTIVEHRQMYTRSGPLSACLEEPSYSHKKCNPSAWDGLKIMVMTKKDRDNICRAGGPPAAPVQEVTVM